MSYPDESFGPEEYFAPGYPFGYLIRDVLQFDASLDEATFRIQNATRTCDLLLGAGRRDAFSGGVRYSRSPLDARRGRTTASFSTPTVAAAKHAPRHL